MKRAITKASEQEAGIDDAPKTSRKVNQEDRPRSLVVRLSEAELQQVHAVAAAEDREVSRVIRRWIREAHARQFPTADGKTG